MSLLMKMLFVTILIIHYLYVLQTFDFNKITYGIMTTIHLVAIMFIIL